MKTFLLFCLCGTLMIVAGFRSHDAGNIPPTYTDSPKKYFLKIDSLPIEEWKNVTDTLGGIFGVIGKSLTVDQSEYYKAAAMRQIIAIGRRITLDSTHSKIKK